MEKEDEVGDLAAELEKVATLMHISLSAEEQKGFMSDLSRVVDAFTKIESVSTEGVEPLVTPINGTLLLRPDEVFESSYDTAIRKEMPEKNDSYLSVKSANRESDPLK